jgi:hypothetical protein
MVHKSKTFGSPLRPMEKYGEISKGFGFVNSFDLGCYGCIAKDKIESLFVILFTN